MSKYRVFSVPYFPVFGPEKTPHLETFYAVNTYEIISILRLTQKKMLIGDDNNDDDDDDDDDDNGGDDDDE